MRGVLLVVVPVLATRLTITPAHANITPDSYSAALLGNGATEVGAFRKAWELLGTVDGEWLGLDLQAVCNMSLARARSLCSTFLALVFVLCLFQLLVETEAQSVLALMSDRQVWKDEIPSGCRAIQVHHSSNWSTGQDCQARLTSEPAGLSNWTRLLKGRKEEVIGVEREGDVVVLALTLSVKYAKLDYWRRIHWTTIG